MIDPRPDGLPPVFIVGSGRCGSTLLRLMLDSGSQISIPGESHFIPHMWARRARYVSDGRLDTERLIDDLLRISTVVRWAAPKDAIRAHLSGVENPTYEDVVGALFRAYATQRGKFRWGDKTPAYARYIPLLSRLFPKSRFIHIIRDGRDVCSSYLSASWGPRTVWQVALRWNSRVTGAMEGGRDLGPGRYLEIRYEDLVRRPSVVLRDVCSFALIPFEDSMLRYHVSAGERLESRNVKGHASVFEPLVQGKRDWRRDMTDKQVVSFEAVSGSLLEELGYERRFPEIPRRFRIKGDVLIEARKAYEVGARIKDFALGLERYGPAPVDDRDPRSEVEPESAAQARLFDAHRAGSSPEGRRRWEGLREQNDRSLEPEAASPRPSDGIQGVDNEGTATGEVPDELTNEEVAEIEDRLRYLGYVE